MKLSHLTRLSCTFPPLVPACFVDDHAVLGAGAVTALSQSSYTRSLLSLMPSISLVGDGVQQLITSLRTFRRSGDPFPPLFPGLRCCHLDLSCDVSRSDEEDHHSTTKKMKRRRAKALDCLAACPLLSSLSLSIQPDYIDQRKLVSILQRMPQLRSLRILHLHLPTSCGSRGRGSVVRSSYHY